MGKVSRRSVLLGGAAAAASGLVPGRPSLAQEIRFRPESGAKLTVLRWESFVDGDRELWDGNSARFSEQTGVPVEVKYLPWPDMRAAAARVASTRSGPDIVFGWYDDPHLYWGRLVILSDVAADLETRFGDWYEVCRRYGIRQGEWIGLPLGVAGSCMVYRTSHMREAGFDAFPTDTDGFLALCGAMAKRGAPPGFVLGPSVGDGAVWTHWLLWAFGGKLVDAAGLVVIDSVQTREALAYARDLYATFVDGTTRWLDPDNNEAFLSGRIGLTANGVSIYDAARRAAEKGAGAPGADLADDIGHANLPVGPIGSPTELYLMTQAMVFDHTPFPMAAKAYLRFMWDREQYIPWQQASLGYVTQPLQAYEDNPIWQQPELSPYRDCTARMLWNGYAGPLGEASAAAMAQHIVVDMVAQAASGAKSPQEAIREAERRANRFYRV